MAKKKKIDTTINTAELVKNVFGANITRTLESLSPDLKVKTGSLTLDYIIGGGIFPGLTEIFGVESAGKSSLGLSIWKNAKEAGYDAFYIDQERSLTEKMLYAISGLDPEEFVKHLFLPDCGEDALKIIETICRNAQKTLIILDSVPACLPKQALEDAEKDLYAPIPRLMSKYLPMVIPLAEVNNIAIIFMNQLRMKMGITYGNPEDTPGGKALKYYAKIRIEMKRGSLIKKGQDKIIGHEIRVRTLKNRFSAPYQSAIVPLIYGRGIDNIWDIKALALQMGIVKKSGAWFYYGEKRFHGEGQLTEALESDKEFFTEIEKLVKENLCT